MSLESVSAMQLKVKIRRVQPPTANRRHLPSPSAPNLRAAQLVAGKIFDGVEPFPQERWRDLERFRPRVLVGPAAELNALAQTMDRRGVELPSVDRAVFILTSLRDTPASDVLRVVLWQTFAVPVYELLLSGSHRILAAECEAHEGWHPMPGIEFWINDGELLVDAPGAKGLATGFTGDITVEPCPCGRPGARVIDVQRYDSNSLCPVRPRYRLAASA